jgi:hypothetical protein
VASTGRQDLNPKSRSQSDARPAQHRLSATLANGSDGPSCPTNPGTANARFGGSKRPGLSACEAGAANQGVFTVRPAASPDAVREVGLVGLTLTPLWGAALAGPEFAPAALELGVAAVFAILVGLGATGVGAYQAGHLDTTASCADEPGVQGSSAVVTNTDMASRNLPCLSRCRCSSSQS